jgi:hypothetical protein
MSKTPETCRPETLTPRLDFARTRHAAMIILAKVARAQEPQSALASSAYIRNIRWYELRSPSRLNFALNDNPMRLLRRQTSVVSNATKWLGSIKTRRRGKISWFGMATRAPMVDKSRIVQSNAKVWLPNTTFAGSLTSERAVLRCSRVLHTAAIAGSTHTVTCEALSTT